MTSNSNSNGKYKKNTKLMYMIFKLVLSPLSFLSSKVYGPQNIQMREIFLINMIVVNKRVLLFILFIILLTS